jgi:hypothetical protein
MLRMTPNQIDRVLHERQHPEARAETDDMGFGTLRHASWQEEAEQTMMLPTAFGVNAEVKYIEQEFTTEIWPSVVVHSRPDVVGQDTVYDYKTILDGKQGWKAVMKSYNHDTKRRQLIFYAFQLGLHGIQIKHGCYLFEIWNKDRDTILGYESVSFPISYRDIAAVVLWAKKRVSLLQAVLAEEASSH